MVASTDKIKDDVTYTSAGRKVSVKLIANDATGSAKSGMYTRAFKVKIRNSGVDLAVNAKATIYIFDPDCKSATVTFSPSATTLTKTTYIQGATKTVITLPTVTPSVSTCHLLVSRTTTVSSAADVTYDTATTGKLGYTVASKTTNIGHFNIVIQYTHTDKAVTKPANAKLTAPITVSTTACESTAVGTCTTAGCLVSYTAAITSSAAALGNKQFTAFALNTGKSTCKLDYTAVVPTKIASYAVATASTRTVKFAAI